MPESLKNAPPPTRKSPNYRALMPTCIAYPSRSNILDLKRVPCGLYTSRMALSIMLI